MRKRAGRLRKAWAAALVGAARVGFALGPVLVACAGEAALPAGDDPQPAARMDATATNTVPASAVAYLRRWLESPPWIQKAVWRVSGNGTRVKTSDKQGRVVDLGPVPGWMRYEGGLQPGGFYLKFAENNPDYMEVITDRENNPVGFRIKNPPPGQELVLGLGGDFYWHRWPGLFFGAEGIRLAPKEGIPGYDPRNRTMLTCQRMRLLVLERLRRLGLWQLAESGPLRWGTEGSFAALSDKHGQVAGRILAATPRGQPRLVTYSVSKPVGITFWLQYAFGPDAQPDLPPSTVIEWNTYDPGVRVTNVVETWVAGLDDAHQRGWRPTEFGAGSLPLVEFLLWSNGVSYAVRKDGTMERVEPGTAPPFGSPPRDFSSYRWLISAVVGGGVLLFALRWWSGSPREMPNTKQVNKER